VLLGADADHEGGNVDSLFADSDVFLEDEDASVVDGVGEVALLDERLESALQELRGGQAEHIIELALVVLQQTESDHSTDQGLTFEKSSGISLLHREENTSSLSELGESELGSPHFSLAAEAVSTDQLEPITHGKDEQSVNATRSNLREHNTYLLATHHTYSLISFSLSKGLLGFLDVLLSSDGKKAQVSVLWVVRCTQRHLSLAAATYSSCTSLAFGRIDIWLIDININFK